MHDKIVKNARPRPCAVSIVQQSAAVVPVAVHYVAAGVLDKLVEAAFK